MPVFPEIGNKVVAKVIDMKGQCTIGLKKDEEYELSVHHCGDFCGYFYHNVFNWVTMLQFGGTFPMGEPDVMEWVCPNSSNSVKIQLIRKK
ncbi:MAG TPA: TIGR04076 family protein [Desulfobacteraceae bacterium]|nr:MAG: TIGR04076 family protein [Deltaproteobacteria bacterium]HDL07164.1 TIGR04076 family protein [Desulfobacteraceae bacterium]